MSNHKNIQPNNLSLSLELGDKNLLHLNYTYYIYI